MTRLQEGTRYLGRAEIAVAVSSVVLLREPLRLLRVRDGGRQGPIDDQFYPDGVRGWMAKADADPAGGIELDRSFFIEWPDGYRPHRVRLQGGDASSDSYRYP